jgi:hypothetical protein
LPDIPAHFVHRGNNRDICFCRDLFKLHIPDEVIHKVILAQAQTMVVCQYNRDWLDEKNDGSLLSQRRQGRKEKHKMLFLVNKNT